MRRLSERRPLIRTFGGGTPRTPSAGFAPRWYLRSPRCRPEPPQDDYSSGTRRQAESLSRAGRPMRNGSGPTEYGRSRERRFTCPTSLPERPPPRSPANRSKRNVRRRRTSSRLVGSSVADLGHPGDTGRGAIGVSADAVGCLTRIAFAAALLVPTLSSDVADPAMNQRPEQSDAPLFSGDLRSVT